MVVVLHLRLQYYGLDLKFKKTGEHRRTKIMFLREAIFKKSRLNSANV